MAGAGRPDTDPDDPVDDGAAVAGIYPRSAVHLQYCFVDHGVAGSDVYPAYA
ncbi:hypothetical protein D3C71_1831580 [compost metagenome]